MTPELKRMQQLADSLEKEDRRAIIIQIWDGEIMGASELVVKALRAYVDERKESPFTMNRCVEASSCQYLIPGCICDKEPGR